MDQLEGKFEAVERLHVAVHVMIIVTIIVCKSNWHQQYCEVVRFPALCGVMLKLITGTYTCRYVGGNFKFSAGKILLICQHAGPSLFANAEPQIVLYNEASKQRNILGTARFVLNCP